MAYKFIERLAKKDEDVKLYLEENMYFEAWITAMRNSKLTSDEFYYKLEQEIYCKSRKITTEEAISLEYEHFDLKRAGWE